MLMVFWDAFCTEESMRFQQLSVVISESVTVVYYMNPGLLFCKLHLSILLWVILDADLRFWNGNVIVLVYLSRFECFKQYLFQKY